MHSGQEQNRSLPESDGENSLSAIENNWMEDTVGYSIPAYLDVFYTPESYLVD